MLSLITLVDRRSINSPSLPLKQHQVPTLLLLIFLINNVLLSLQIFIPAHRINEPAIITLP